MFRITSANNNIVLITIENKQKCQASSSTTKVKTNHFVDPLWFPLKPSSRRPYTRNTEILHLCTTWKVRCHFNDVDTESSINVQPEQTSYSRSKARPFVECIRSLLINKNQLVFEQPTSQQSTPRQNGLWLPFTFSSLCLIDFQTIIQTEEWFGLVRRETGKRCLSRCLSLAARPSSRSIW